MPCDVCKLVEEGEKNPGWIASLPNSVALVYEDQFLPGRVIIVLKRHAEDLLELSSQEGCDLYEEMIKVARAVQKVMQPEKMNYAMLGNEKAHVHWHIIPRLPGGYKSGEAPWPHPERHLTEKEYKELASKFREQL